MSQLEQFNELSAAEAERLALLAEEMGDAIQAIGKILRHGYASHHPESQQNNRDNLEHELGDVRFAMLLMCEAGDVDKQEIHDYADEKRESVAQYLHHQPHANPIAANPTDGTGGER